MAIPFLDGMRYIIGMGNKYEWAKSDPIRMTFTEDYLAEMGGREAVVERLEKMCGLNPDAVGVGGSIDTTSPVMWRVRKWGYEHKVMVSDVTGGELVDIVLERASPISK